jgi:hypothetical protein
VVPNGVVDVLLLDLPVPLWADTSTRQDLLLAALRPIAEEDPDSPPARLLAIVDRLRPAFDEASAPSELELRAAAARGLKQVDVAYGVPCGVRDDLAALADAFDAAEDYCRTNGDGALALPAECTAFRRWFLGQVVTQLDGGFPTPWA